ncbi:hypothetical protein KK062_27725 [Fulvivirgaceae bacterium PWU5]|uniref:Uncharacterized protein n=1 Tax=Dawidia cretensis TaxID=2782350 RepID=A0AAP2GX42_9BACT|nr:hypothetical protein [Dawidia cretensis]MBT1712062.1 hypothetical protein [Dawidia cretensis]
MSLRRNNYIFLGLLMVLFACDTKQDFEGEFQNYFIKYYGEDGNQDAVDMVVNADGTALLLGNTQVLGWNKRMVLIKVDARGEVLWEKRFGTIGGNDENAQDLEPTADGNFLILSNTLYGTDPNTNDAVYDFKVLRIRGDGSVVDSMYFGNNDNTWNTQFAHSITALSNGGFVVTGNSTDETIYYDPPNSEQDLEDLFAVGFDRDFTRSWTTVEDRIPPAQGPGISLGEHIGSGIKVLEKSPSEFYWFTYSDGLRGGPDADYESNFNEWILNDNGLNITGASFSGDDTREERLASAIQVPAALGGGYYEFGTSAVNSGIVVNPDAWGDLYFCRRNSTRGLIDEGIVRGLSGSFLAHAVAPAVRANGFLLLGHEKTTLGSLIRLTQVDLSSAPRWSANFGAFDKNSRGAAVAELPDGRILVLGTIELETQRKIALFKLNAQGELLD